MASTVSVETTSPAGLRAVISSLSELRHGLPAHRAEDVVRPLIARIRNICGIEGDSAGKFDLLSQAVVLTVDLPFRFRGTSGNYCILLGSINQESIQAFESGVRNASAFRSIGLFFCLTPGSRQYVSQRSAFLNRWCVVIDADDMQRVLTSPHGRDALRDLILERIPKEQLVPFSTSAPAEGPCFVGRIPELRAMICGDQDYALCGKGGAGKSSLLRQMRWILRSWRDDRFSRLVEVELHGITDLREAARRIAVAIDANRFAQEVSVASLEPFLRRIRSACVACGMSIPTTASSRLTIVIMAAAFPRET